MTARHDDDTDFTAKQKMIVITCHRRAVSLALSGVALSGLRQVIVPQRRRAQGQKTPGTLALRGTGVKG